MSRHIILLQGPQASGKTRLARLIDDLISPHDSTSLWILDPWDPKQISISKIQRSSYKVLILIAIKPIADPPENWHVFNLTSTRKSKR